MSSKSSADRPLTRQQTHELVDEFLSIIQLVSTRTSFAEAQWQRIRARLKAIIDRVVVEAPPPLVRVDGASTTDEELARIRKDRDAETSGKRLRERILEKNPRHEF
jgi:hypothetical protein